MRVFRLRALSVLGAGAALSLVGSAQEPQNLSVSYDTPASLVAKYARVAHAREYTQSFLKVALSAMGAHVKLPKRLYAKADYYEAWLSRIQDRAYPNETIPEDQYLRATQQRLGMASPPASAFGTATAGGPALGAPGFRALGVTAKATNPMWQLVGPTRTAVPYVTFYGPANSYVSGRVGGIAFSPTDANTVYMTGAAGGVFKTTNGGTNWTNLTGINAPYVGPIAISPTNPNLIIVGAGDFDGGVGVGNGLFRSTDGGASWTSIQATSITNVAFSNIVFDASTPNRLVASAGRRGNSNGLWQSLDNGVTWAKLAVAGSSTRGLTTLSAGPAAANGDRPMYTTTEYPAQVYSSRDAGRTWSVIANYPGAGKGAANVATASAVDPNVVYATNDNDKKIFRGTLAGGAWTWTDITGNFPGDYNWSQSFYDYHIHAAKHTVNGTVRDTVYVGLITISSWDGASWTDFGATYTGNAKTHNDQHTWAVFPGDSTKMAIGNDGGIYGVTIAANGAHTINARMNGDATMAMFYSGAWHPTNASKMFGGTQDNASPVAIGDIANWSNRTGGDGTGAAIDNRNPNRQYGAAQYLAMYRTTDAWSSQLGLNYDFDGNDPNGAPFVGRFACDTSAEGYLYVGGNSKLFRYNPATNAVSSTYTTQTFAGSIRAIIAAPSDPSVIYVGTGNGYVYQSRDRGVTWRTLVTPTAALGAITSFSVHPTKPYDVLFTTGQTATHVYRFADASTAAPVRTAAGGSGAGSLPNIFASSVCRNLKNPDTMWYVSNDVGVFGTITGGGSWFNMTEPMGLPPVEGSTIEHTIATGYLNLATYGRGMWRLKIDDVATPPSLSVVEATIRRTASNVVALTVKIRNVGDSTAQLARITAAPAIFENYYYPPFTPIPIQLGSIAPGATKETTITYRDAALTPGRNGNVGLKIDWRFGTETFVLNAPVSVTLP